MDLGDHYTLVDDLIRQHEFTNLKGLIYFTDGYGTFNLSGGEVFTDEVNLNGRPGGKGYGILNVTGGELNVGTNGIRKSSTNDRYEIHLGGGTIRASNSITTSPFTGLRKNTCPCVGSAGLPPTIFFPSTRHFGVPLTVVQSAGSNVSNL